ncbi:MAG: hypothetical protein E5X05_01290 [Mesorhizobium sp.]|nr:MAG: hypothetical protein E5X05_01290 [Mesorhizobium sp.]
MRRDYIIRRAADIDENVDAENYLARTVYEPEELIDIGILDADGNKVMARQRMDPIGFIRWRS